MITTAGHLLNKRVRYTQSASGFRSGIEPVLLAASIPARPGQQVLEGGTGAGAGLLCLAARVPGVTGCGVEIDPTQAALARDNVAANGMAGLTILTGDLSTMPLDGVFDHAFANPPYHLGLGTVSDDADRDRSKRGSPALLTAWAVALARSLRHRGTLTFILPAASLPVALAAMSAGGCAPDLVLPLWPHVNAPAKLLLLRGIKGGRAAMRLLPGVVLHEADGRYTTAAGAILRDGGVLTLDHGKRLPPMAY